MPFVLNQQRKYSWLVTCPARFVNYQRQIDTTRAPAFEGVSVPLPSHQGGEEIGALLHLLKV
jgi:hypothetical protein